MARRSVAAMVVSCRSMSQTMASSVSSARRIAPVTVKSAAGLGTDGPEGAVLSVTRAVWKRCRSAANWRWKPAATTSLRPSPVRFSKRCTMTAG